jgi:hypothetical protein
MRDEREYKKQAMKEIRKGDTERELKNGGEERDLK